MAPTSFRLMASSLARIVRDSGSRRRARARSQRSRSGTWIAALGCLAGCSGGSPGSQSGRTLDVLLVTLDSVRADDLTFLDRERAPNLTRLAERGTIFTEAVAGSSWTLPTHVELFTGQPPSLHRVETDDVSIDPETPTLPRLFADAGWFTAGVYSGWYLSPEFGFGRGFARYVSAMEGGAELEREFREGLDGRDMRSFWQAIADRDKQSHEEVSSRRVTDLAGQELAKLVHDDNVLFFAHYFDPHYDYVPPEDWATKFDPTYTGPIDGHDFWTNPLVWDWRNNRRVVDERGLEHLRALYRGEIGWTDQWIGELLDRFDAAGRLDDLLIVVTSDHGEEFLEHGNRGHKQTIYDEVLRVPLLVVLPPSWGGSPPRSVDTQVALADVLPTLLEAARVDTPPSVAGRSLLPLLRGEQLPPRPVVSSLELFGSEADGSWRVFLMESLRVVDGARREKLLRIVEHDHTGRHVVSSAGLFDLTADPGETRPVVGGTLAVASQDPRFRAAWNELEAELERLRALDRELPHAPPHERTTTMARALASELAGLGYVDADNPGEETASRLVPWGLGFRPPEPLPQEER